MSDSWKIDRSFNAPEWFKDAVASGVVTPVDPKINDWFGNGVRIVATGRIIRLGEVISQDDLA